MSSLNVDSPLPPAPQSDRLADPPPPVEPRNLWQHLLATVTEVGNALDPFANDTHPDVRALGRVARQRHPRHANDYFALGDLCARLAFDGTHLTQIYIEKTMLAYTRAGECSASDAAVARRLIFAFAVWVAEVARVRGTFLDLELGLRTCERALLCETAPLTSASATQLQALAERLRLQMTRLLNDSDLIRNAATELTPQRLSQKLTDEGQTLLRQQRTADALTVFARAIETDPHNSVAWLWQALALTDVARFAEALVSYDQAIQLDPGSYGARNSKGALLLELGQVEAALECFEQALTMPAPPPSVKAAFLLNKGKALYLLERYAEACEALQQSAVLEPSPESAAGVMACQEMLGKDHAVAVTANA